MDGEIEFGDVQHAQPRTQRRPDADLHYSVAAYGQPGERELPIFVDLDVLIDMEEHAASDTSVELGGVLLGGQYEDADGRPFVVITDCLRAQHYESTKGSFKFTHETWAEITRQRDEFPEELQMVGWYHTHPDWGVFLSGMDMFICDHFFNKSLDVAYVIDPCRGDRGMFQWTKSARQRVRRTSGFYVMASRFRAVELEQYVEQLQQKGLPMPANLPHGSHAPVVHITQPQPPAWQGIAVWGTLVAQFCLLAIIAWRMIGTDTNPAQVAEASAASTSKREAAIEAEFLDRVLQKLHDTPEGFTEEIRAEFGRSRELAQRLETEQRQHQALLNEMDADRRAAKSTIRSLEASVAKRDQALELLQTRLEDERAKLARREEQLAAAGLGPKAASKTSNASADESPAADTRSWWVYGAAGLAGILAIACVAVALSLRRSGCLDEEFEDASAAEDAKASSATRETDEAPSPAPHVVDQPAEMSNRDVS